jgi:hypothetical protein
MDFVLAWPMHMYVFKFLFWNHSDVSCCHDCVWSRANLLVEVQLLSSRCFTRPVNVSLRVDLARLLLFVSCRKLKKLSFSKVEDTRAYLTPPVSARELPAACPLAHDKDSKGTGLKIFVCYT